jgi:transcriptional regulator NrdR family protein
MADEHPREKDRGSEGPACPHCGHTYSRVLEARSPMKRDDYRRRRECSDCHQRFTTYEAAKKAA